jgi:DNA-binding GntR family transcriptional regulator
MPQQFTEKPPIRSLREEVYEHLRTLMNQRRLQPGRFLNLNALAEEMGISRTPLRDALLRLECEGFVEILNRRGVRVKELTLESIRDLYGILGGLESAALRSVSDQVTPVLVDRMDELNLEMSEALDCSDFARFYEANLAFHDTYLNLSSNERMVHWIHILKHRLYDFPRLEGFVPEWERESIREHWELVRLLDEGKIIEGADFLRDVHWSFSHQEPFIRRYYAARSGEAEAGG